MNWLGPVPSQPMTRKQEKSLYLGGMLQR